MKSWNYRLLAYKYGDDVEFEIHEVFYNKKGKPSYYGQNEVCVCGEDIKYIKWKLKMIKNCLKKPILWSGDKFPKKYKKK